MKRVQINKDYDHIVDSMTTIAFKGGTVVEQVTDAHANAIVEAGAGEILGDANETAKEKKRKR
jgi:hypothetical protein